MFGTLKTGKRAEDFAKDYLKRHGLKFVQSNYRCKHGEIDLIMRDQTTTVFVEVRYRNNTDFGTGAETVDYKKQSKLLASAAYYLQSHPDAARGACRIDVMSLTRDSKNRGEPFQVEWIPNAVQA
jgi:putative endonuclease